MVTAARDEADLRRPCWLDALDPVIAVCVPLIWVTA
jgi:hypothetical protein